MYFLYWPIMTGPGQSGQSLCDQTGGHARFQAHITTSRRILLGVNQMCEPGVRLPQVEVPPVDCAQLI
jgi:hypothetical protein